MPADACPVVDRPELVIARPTAGDDLAEDEVTEQRHRGLMVIQVRTVRSVMVTEEDWDHQDEQRVHGGHGEGHSVVMMTSWGSQNSLSLASGHLRMRMSSTSAELQAHAARSHRYNIISELLQSSV